MSFEDFGLSPSILDSIETMGYDTPTPIQAQAIPVILDRKDLLACAQTGTGKTAAYLLPVIDNLLYADVRHLNTLIIAPTRELVLQIEQQVEGMAYYTGVSCIAVYGGGDGITWERQKRAMQEGADIVIGTPGRLIAHLRSGKMDFSHLEHLILDEADRMLDMGFHDDIMHILGYLPKERQTLLFSATMPDNMRKLARSLLYEPEEINIAISRPADKIDQRAYMTYDSQKIPFLEHFLTEKSFDQVLIFASTKEKVKSLFASLRRLKYSVQAFHSDLEQEERERIMQDFKNKKLNILVGTDVLSRGIDIEGIDLVVNFDVAQDPEDYVHRIGRTARAERTGTAVTFINEKDISRFQRIEKLIEREIPKLPLPEGFEPGPSYTSSRSKSGGGASGRSKKPNWKRSNKAKK